MKKHYFLFAFVILTFVSSISFGQTYTWQGADGADWTVSTNWNPSRVTPAITDVLQFNDGGTYTVTNVQTQSISQLLVTNNTNVSFFSTAAKVLTIRGTTATVNLQIETGSVLQISSTGANRLDITYNNVGGQLADISGDLIINPNTAFNNSYITTYSTTITTVNTGGRIINNGGVVTGAATRLQFATGSEYQHNMNAGIVPTSSWDSNSTLNISGTFVTTPTGLNQTLGNFILNSPTRIINVVTGITILGNLTVTDGTMRYQTTPAATVNILGDVNVGLNGVFDAGTGALKTHILNLSGNLNVDGTFDMNTSAGVKTNFLGATNNTITGTGAICDFYDITVNKGTDITSILDVQNVITQYVRTATGNSLTITIVR